MYFDIVSAQDYLADAVTLNGRLIYQAGKEHGLKPVVGEVYDQGIIIQNNFWFIWYHLFPMQGDFQS